MAILKHQLVNSGSGERVQVFPLAEGSVNLTSTDGAQTGYVMSHCVDDGTITITWGSGNTDDIACISGDDFSFEGATSVTIVSGTFHFA